MLLMLLPQQQKQQLHVCYYSYFYYHYYFTITIYYFLLKRRLFKGYFTNRFRLEYVQSYITSSSYHFLIGRHNTNAKYIETYVIILWPMEKLILDAQNECAF